MKLVFKIAYNEWRNLFYSPIAWFLTIAFFVQCALVYSGSLHRYASMQEMGGFGRQGVHALTDGLFTSSYTGLFATAINNLYLYIPLLTMGLISREINGGSISLLYSSPIRMRQIVLGKYVAMALYNLLLLAVLLVFVVSGVFQITSPDIGLLLSALLGFYLLLNAFAAIGLFMSSLTSYQVVAAIGTFLIVGFLSYIGQLWQDIDFVRDLTYFLSLNGRTGHMLSGLIVTKDVLYFLVVIAMFLAFTIYKLKNASQSLPLRTKMMRYTVVVAAALCIGYIGSRPGVTGYWDTTANKVNTLTPNTQKIIVGLRKTPLEVTSYGNFLDPYSSFGRSDHRNEFMAKWEPYVRFKPDIQFNFVNYYDTAISDGYNMFSAYKGKTLKEVVDQRAKAGGFNISHYLRPDEIRKIIDLRPESNRYVMQLKYNGKSTYLRVFNDQQMWPSETEVSAAFQRLLETKMPKIMFAAGDQERDITKKGDRFYKSMTVQKTFREALINQGFDVDTLSLCDREIPDSITALVIADPLTSLSPASLEHVQQFINGGGNLLIAGEPGRQEMINPLLQPLGVKLMDGMLAQKSEDYQPSLVLPRMTQAALHLNGIADKPFLESIPVSMNGVAALSAVDTLGYNIRPLLRTVAGKTYNDQYARNPDMDMVSEPAVTASSLDTLNKKRHNSVAVKDTVYTTALALTRTIHGKNQKIVVMGDADFMSNAELFRNSPRACNFNFATALFGWLDNGQFPVDTSRPDSRDNNLKLSLDQAAVLKLVYVWLLPALLVISGAVLLIRRRRK